MMNFNVNILKKNGEKEFAVIPYEVFVKIRDELDDYECLKALLQAKAKESKAKATPLNQVKKQFNIK